MKHLIHYALLFFYISLLLLNCDSTVTTNLQTLDSTYISSLTVQPSFIKFSLDSDGYKDTTVNISVSSKIVLNKNELVPRFIVTNLTNRKVVTSGTLSPTESNIFTTNFELATSTTISQNYIVQVFVFDNSGNSNTAEHNIELVGFANARPEIIEVSNPTEVIIPSGSDVLIVPFTAKVTDVDGQSNIDQVFIEFINSDRSILVPKPNTLLDNGQNEDVAANDSVYTIAFTINSNNTPANRTARYFAVDQAGLFSDTLTTTFNIVQN